MAIYKHFWRFYLKIFSKILFIFATGSSGVLNSSYEDSHNRYGFYTKKTVLIFKERIWLCILFLSNELIPSNFRSAPEARSSYYFGEAPDFKDILNNVKNGNGSCRIDSTNCDIVDGEDKTHHGLISPHTGEVMCHH